MSFIQKPKRRKKIIPDKRVTLESKHREIVQDFEYRRTTLSDKKKELTSLESKYDKQEEKDFNLFNEIQKLKKLIDNNDADKVNSEESDYHVNTFHILIEYGDRHEQNQEHRSIAQLHNKYMSVVDPKNNHYISDDDDNDGDDMCQNEDCSGNGKNVIKCKEEMVCGDCGMITNKLISLDTPEFKDMDRITVKVPFRYKKSGYFEKIKKQLQAKVNPNIPLEDLDIIGNEIKRYRITKEDVNYHIFKELLKKLSKTDNGTNPKRFTNYYKFIPYLLNYFFEIPAPDMSPDLEFRLNTYFLKVEKAFVDCIKGKAEFDNRSSILNSEYTMYKLLELLGGNDRVYDNLLPYFRLLKDKNKLRFLDKMWKTICNYNGWTFIATKLSR